MAEYIEREALLGRMNDYCVRNCHDTTYCISCFMTDAKEIVDSQDAEDVWPVMRGKWEGRKTFLHGTIVKCSLCGNFLDLDGVNAGRGNANFCPNCGADMRGEEDEKA